MCNFSMSLAICRKRIEDSDTSSCIGDHYIGEVHVCAAEITISSRSTFWPFKRYTYRVSLDDNVKNEFLKKPFGNHPFLLSRMKSNHPHTIKTIWCCYVEEFFIIFFFFENKNQHQKVFIFSDSIQTLICIYKWQKRYAYILTVRCVYIFYLVNYDFKNS